jgi:hypothetical protein
MKNQQQQQEDKIIGVLALCGALISIVALSIMADLDAYEAEQDGPKPVFIWNDDIESVPNQGYIKVDTIVNDTIYLSPDE